MSPEKSEPTYWTEREWERHLLENEHLVDRYQKIFENDPERRWDDPMDLYYKVHHGIDLGKDFKSSSLDDKGNNAESEPSDQSFVQEEPEIADRFDQIEAYQAAFRFAVAVLEFIKEFKFIDKENPKQSRRLIFHGTKIAADIAGGHGLGYDEDSLCGNIVKNRWALDHLRKTRMILQEFSQIESSEKMNALIQHSQILEALICARIALLRAKVWW